MILSPSKMPAVIQVQNIYHWSINRYRDNISDDEKAKHRLYNVNHNYKNISLLKIMFVIIL